MDKTQPTGLTGIQLLSGPSAQSNAGVFNLPPGFDSKRFSANWVKEGGEVESAKQRETILGTQMTADGWEIYKGKDGKAIKAISGKNGTYVLMFRPIAVTANVNAIYGNVGKHVARAEQQAGVVSLSENGQDSGMMPMATLDAVVPDREFAVDPNDNHFAENPVQGVGSGNVSAPPLRT